MRKNKFNPYNCKHYKHRCEICFYMTQNVNYLPPYECFYFSPKTRITKIKELIIKLIKRIKI